MLILYQSGGLMYNKEMQKILENVWARTALGLAGLAFLVFGLSKLDSGNVNAKVSDEFIDKYNEVGELTREVSAGPAIGAILKDLPAKDAAKDYTGAAKLVSDGLKEIAGLVSKTVLLGATIGDFRELSGAIADPVIKEAALKVAGLWDKRSVIFLKVLGFQRAILEPAKKYYDGLAAGQSVAAPDEKTINDIGKKIAEEGKTMSQLTKDIDAAVKELATVADIAIENE